MTKNTNPEDLKLITGEYRLFETYIMDCVINARDIVFTSEEWRQIYLFSTDIQTIERNTSMMAQVFNNPYSYSTMGGHKHFLTEALYFDSDRGQMYMGCRVILKNR